MKLLTALIAAVFSLVSFTVYAENAPSSHEKKAAEMKHEEKHEAKRDEKHESKRDEKREVRHEAQHEKMHRDMRQFQSNF